MTEPVVAKLWWEAPHDGVLERFMVAGDVIAFGRGSDCAVRVGHAPVYQPQVPRRWGEISFHRGLVYVENASTRWGIKLVPTSETPAAAWIDVPPGAGAASPASRFRIVALAPSIEVVIEVLTGRNRRQLGSESGVATDPPSFVPFALTPTQKLVGTAVIAPLLEGRPRRAGYSEVARATHYAERTVREAVAAMDGLFILHGLVDPASASDALDRVAHTLRLHTSLVAKP